LPAAAGKGNLALATAPFGASKRRKALIAWGCRIMAVVGLAMTPQLGAAIADS